MNTRGRGHRRSYEGNNRERGFYPKQKNEWSKWKRPDTAAKKEEKKPETVTPVKVKTEAVESKTPIQKTVEKPSTTSSSARERSPIDKIIEPKKEVTTNNNASFSTNKDSVLRYSGRPGEKKFSGRCRLFVANLHSSTTEDDLRNMFSAYGETGEVYFNKDKGFGFIRLDYRHNAELAKSALDKTVVKSRTIQVRFATHASALELHGLDQYASNEIIEKAMSQFGNVERAVVVCDDRGRSKGYAIVEFEWKKSAQKVLDRFKEEMFVLGRLPKPVFAKPLTQQDEEDGINESQLERVPGIQQEREFNPRFISPSSFEYQWSQKWRDLYIEEQDKKAKLDRELEDARYKVELEMETALREQEANRIREDLARRQEELRKIEEDMHARRQMAQFPHLRHGQDNIGGRGPGRDFNNRGPSRGNDGQDFQNSEQFLNQNDMRMRQHNDIEIMGGDLLRNAGLPVMNIRPEMIRPGLQMSPGILPRHAIPQGMQAGVLPNPRGPPGMQLQMRPQMMPGGPGPGRDMPPRGGGDRRFDNKRPRRD